MPLSVDPHWQLPTGVSRGSWEYMHSPDIAYDYDEFFAYNRLFELDEQELARHLPQSGLVADLGCGTGRALLPLVRRGMRGLAIDLSEEMLSIVQEKAEIEDLPITGVLANLVELDCLATDSIDHAICMFSTLGMIQGQDFRQKALRHVRRILRSDGRFVLHVHNYWYNLYDPGGPWWLIKNLFRSILVGDIERGDKYFPYRGIPNMYLHVFTLGELKRELRTVGFQVQEIIPLDARRMGRLRYPWWLGRLRANGWICVCQ